MSEKRFEILRERTVVERIFVGAETHEEAKAIAEADGRLNWDLIDVEASHVFQVSEKE